MKPWIQVVMETDYGSDHNGLMDIEEVQKVLNRSRASIYRYVNNDYLQAARDPGAPSPKINPKKLNPELRLNKEEPLRFHPTEVARFARDILKIKQVTIEVREAPPTPTQELLQAILAELQSIHQLLKARG